MQAKHSKKRTWARRVLSLVLTIFLLIGTLPQELTVSAANTLSPAVWTDIPIMLASAADGDTLDLSGLPVAGSVIAIPAGVNTLTIKGDISTTYTNTYITSAGMVTLIIEDLKISTPSNLSGIILATGSTLLLAGDNSITAVGRGAGVQVTTGNTITVDSLNMGSTDGVLNITGTTGAAIGSTGGVSGTAGTAGTSASKNGTAGSAGSAAANSGSIIIAGGTIRAAGLNIGGGNGGSGGNGGAGYNCAYPTTDHGGTAGGAGAGGTGGASTSILIIGGNITVRHIGGGTGGAGGTGGRGGNGYGIINNPYNGGYGGNGGIGNTGGAGGTISIMNTIVTATSIGGGSGGAGGAGGVGGFNGTYTISGAGYYGGRAGNGGVGQNGGSASTTLCTIIIDGAVVTVSDAISGGNGGNGGAGGVGADGIWAGPAGNGSAAGRGGNGGPLPNLTLTNNATLIVPRIHSGNGGNGGKGGNGGVGGYLAGYWTGQPGTPGAAGSGGTAGAASGTIIIDSGILFANTALTTMTTMTTVITGQGGAAGALGVRGSYGGVAGTITGTAGTAGYNSTTAYSPVITSGNIFADFVRYTAAAGTTTTTVLTNTNNGGTYGPEAVYRAKVTVVDIEGAVVPDPMVYVRNLGITSSYDYIAAATDMGIAYIWLPLGSQNVEAEHEEHGNGIETTTIVNNNNNAVTVKLGMRTTLKKSGIAFLTDTNATPGTLSVKAENVNTGALKKIVKAEWFRVSASDTTNYRETFDTAIVGMASANKGDSDTNTTLLEQSGGDDSERNYEMEIGENGIYWVKVYYVDGLGTPRSQIRSIMIDNIFTQASIISTGVEQGNNTNVLYSSTVAGLIGKTGVAYDLDDPATIISSTADGSTVAVGSTAECTVYPETLSAWTAVDTDKTVKIDGTNLSVQFEYTLKVGAIKISFDTQGGTPNTIADQYFMSGDPYGTLPTVEKTDYEFQGWMQTGGTIVTAGTPVASGNHTLYAQWKNNSASMILAPSVATAQSGTNVTWSLLITNPSTSMDTMSGIQLTTVLPAGLLLNQDSVMVNGIVDPAGDDILTLGTPITTPAVPGSPMLITFETQVTASVLNLTLEVSIDANASDFVPLTASDIVYVEDIDLTYGILGVDIGLWSVPKQFDFGYTSVSDTAESIPLNFNKYQTHTRDDGFYTRVYDHRTVTTDCWDLIVSVSKLENEQNPSDILSGASIKITTDYEQVTAPNQNQAPLDPEGIISLPSGGNRPIGMPGNVTGNEWELQANGTSSYTIMRGDANVNLGTWNVRIPLSSVKLELPPNAGTKGAYYKGKMSWMLSVGP